MSQLSLCVINFVSDINSTGLINDDKHIAEWCLQEVNLIDGILLGICDFDDIRLLIAQSNVLLVDQLNLVTMNVGVVFGAVE